jgi:hypothetical protein
MGDEEVIDMVGCRPFHASREMAVLSDFGWPGGPFEGSKRGVDLGHVFSHECINQSCSIHGLDRLMSFWCLRS